MADPSATDSSADRDSGDGVGAMPFDPLTGGIGDLIQAHRACWLWPEVAVDLQDLAALIDNASSLLTGLCQPITPDWAAKASQGIARSITAVHEHADRHSSYAAAARSLWTTSIPRAEPTLTDAQIYALLAIVEARSSADAFCEIASGIEDELRHNAIGHDEADEIGLLRGEFAQWERESWRWADQTKAAAERFLLMATFAASSPSAAALQQAEQQVAILNRHLGTARDAVRPYRAGRKPGAVSKLTRALQHLVQHAGSADFELVMPLIEQACYGDPIEGVQFQEWNDHKVWYRDVVTAHEDTISIANLRRRLTRLPAI
ncbi:hypothetical protein [Paracidovorax sp. MALMAid1276]|uniref:hypothetical protein n=1 Tax=Paracidovorax sp. MALMAid1276 TaxID=3411631 RepID=UPI003BA0090E